VVGVSMYGFKLEGGGGVNIFKGGFENPKR